MKILENSTAALSKLKGNIEQLVDFFRGICGGINQSVDRDLEEFLRHINQGIVEGSSPDEIESVNLAKVVKRVSCGTPCPPR